VYCRSIDFRLKTIFYWTVREWYGILCAFLSVRNRLRFRAGFKSVPKNSGRMPKTRNPRRDDKGKTKLPSHRATLLLHTNAGSECMVQTARRRSNSAICGFSAIRAFGPAPVLRGRGTLARYRIQNHLLPCAPMHGQPRDFTGATSRWRSGNTIAEPPNSRANGDLARHIVNPQNDPGGTIFPSSIRRF
jgi:hypothetical protein